MSDDSIEINEPSKKKRKRTIIPPEQVQRLEKLFNEEPWPNRTKKEILAHQLGQSEHFVSVWFQNRRARFKKEELTKQQTVKSQGDGFKPIASTSHLNNHNKHKEKSETAEENEATSSSVHSIPDNTSAAKKNMPYFRIVHTPHEKVLPIVNRSSSHYEEVQFKTNKKVMKILVKPRFEEKKYIYNPSNNTFTPLKTNTCVYTITPETPSVSEFKEDDSNESNHPSEVSVESKTQSIQIDDWRQQNPTEKDEDHIETKQEPPETSKGQANNPVSSENRTNLFKAFINMICVVEGGIMDKNDPDYDTAVKDALYGILIGNNRLVYDKDSGLSLIPCEDLNACSK